LHACLFETGTSSVAVAVVNTGNATTCNTTSLNFADFIGSLQGDTTYDVVDVFAKEKLGTFKSNFR
jgi:hypothetical protein